AKFIRRALLGKPLEIYGDGRQTRDFIYIDDLVRAVMLAATAGGCTPVRWAAYAWAPDIKEKVPAECKALYGQTVAVVVATNLAIDHENPGLPLDLSMKIGEELSRNVSKCQVVDALKVVNFQAANFGWRDMPKDQLAERLGATHVLVVTVNAFSTVDPMTRELSLVNRFSAELGKRFYDHQEPVEKHQ
ncbi:MAG: NAD-dependent epimerase/dehydratase family protein, partial [Planctomycetota bacterium]|nr:NAD-dependent epimerase/dehydratase family protein [Planctomycetota bacterium]